MKLTQLNRIYHQNVWCFCFGSLPCLQLRCVTLCVAESISIHAVGALLHKRGSSSTDNSWALGSRGVDLHFFLATKETDYENALIPILVKKACYDALSLRSSDCLTRMRVSSLKIIRIK